MICEIKIKPKNANNCCPKLLSFFFVVGEAYGSDVEGFMARLLKEEGVLDPCLVLTEIYVKIENFNLVEGTVREL